MTDRFGFCTLPDGGFDSNAAAEHEFEETYEKDAAVARGRCTLRRSAGQSRARSNMHNTFVAELIRRRIYTPLSRSPGTSSPGVKKACDEFLADKPESVSVLYSGHYTTGYFRKK